MTDERTVPTTTTSDLTTFKIRSDGNEISSEYQVVSITVIKEANRISSAQIVFLDGDTAKEDFALSNKDEFIPGKEIEILAGYHSDETIIFTGIITHHAIKVRKNKTSVLIIDCKDKAVKMTIGRKNRYYYDSIDSDIFEEIINEYGLEQDVEPTNVQHKEMVKFYTTDWDFLVCRSDMNGRLVFVDDGKVSIKAPDTNQEPVLSLIYGSTMMEFEAGMDALDQFTNVTSNSWDYTNQELIDEESEDPGIKEQGNLDSNTLATVIGLDVYPLQHSGKIDDQELKAWSNSALLRSRLSKIQGRVRCQGFAGVKPGTVINLNGVGDRFNGHAFVSAVRHQLNSKNWESEIQFGLSPKWFAKAFDDVMDTPAAGLLPAIQGLHIGVVSQLENDPDGEDRVLVKMPIVDPNDEGVWARVATLDAGEKRGSFFRPEIGDEVVLGFLQNDPRDPVILGMFNSSDKPAPFTASDENPEKGFVTRSEMKLIFNDEKKSIHVETPNGNTVTVSDEEGSIKLTDENGNTIEMSADGITLESAKDIIIKATGDIKCEGTNIESKANAQFKAEGSAGAEVSSSATSILKGSLVQIN